MQLLDTAHDASDGDTSVRQAIQEVLAKVDLSGVADQVAQDNTVSDEQQQSAGQCTWAQTFKHGD